MKGQEEFKADIYAKQNVQLQLRRKRRTAALICVPLAALVVCCSVLVPVLKSRLSITETGTDDSKACTLWAQPDKLMDLDIHAVYRAFYSGQSSEESAADEAAADEAKETPDSAEMEKSSEDYAELERQTELLRKQQEECRIEPEFSRAVNGFAKEMTPLIAEGFGENDCWSPLSAYYAFAMAGAGAKGDTQAELLELLNAKDTDWLADQCDKYYRQHYHANDFCTFTLANSLWLDDRRDYREEFLETAKSKYYTSLFGADFTDPVVNKEISEWVSDNTNGLLRPEFDCDPTTMAVLLNTVYFKAAWTDEFYPEANTEDDFTRADGSTVTAEFMHRGDNQNVYFGENFTRASLDLENNAEMVFILPDEGVTPQELLSDSETFEEMFYPLDSDDTEFCQVEWSVPKFSIDSDFSLTDAFSKVLPTVFDSVLADFSGISPQGDLYLDEIKHGTHIAIDENGVEAAAYTALDATTGAAEPPDKTVEMNLNRPFLFAIVAEDNVVQTGEDDTRESSILFVGVCGDPTATGSSAGGSAAGGER